jgi:hypothetical protein
MRSLQLVQSSLRSHVQAKDWKTQAFIISFDAV